MIVLLCLLLFVPPSAYAQDPPATSLVAEIEVPSAHALVRGDVPVYGRAYGPAFKEFFLEYGQGPAPQEWSLIHHSTEPQETLKGLSSVNFDLVKTVAGNLGMWTTGLTEYDYGDYDVDLPIGTYTLRLRVVDISGREVEMRVPVEVGRVALNCMANRIDSPDQEAVLLIPEHAMEVPAKVFALISIPTPTHIQNSSENFKLVSRLFRLRPVGMPFTLPVRLNIQYDPLKVKEPGHVGICAYNVRQKMWAVYPSILLPEGAAETVLESIPDELAIFGVFESQEIDNKTWQEQPGPVRKIVWTTLCHNTFDDGPGSWKNKHGSKGAQLEVMDCGPSQGKCLKLSNRPGEGNFAAQAYDQDFDAGRYPYLDFDYNIPPEVKVNVLLKVNGQWFDIVFTDDEKTYWDLHMEKIGTVEDAHRDRAWHHARLNIYNMLKGHTESFLVEEIVFADWDSTGFKQLEFGTTPKGAQYFIDNFKISSSQYFWQIGWDDHSAEEFGAPLIRDAKYTYMLQQPFKTFPKEWPEDVTIKFSVPKDIPEMSYRLTIKFVDSQTRLTQPEMRIANNQVLIPQGHIMISPNRLDVILDSLAPGAHSLRIKNLAVDGYLDSLSLCPLGPGPWVLATVPQDEKQQCLFLGESFEPQNSQTLSLYHEDRLILYFYPLSLESRYKIEIIPVPHRGLSESSWLNLRKMQVFINNEMFKEVIYGNTDHALEFLIPEKYLRKGINSVSFQSAPSQGIFLKKITILKDPAAQ